MKMSEEARKARSEYFRQWRKKNPEKARQYQQRHWEKKAKEQKA